MSTDDITYCREENTVRMHDGKRNDKMHSASDMSQDILEVMLCNDASTTSKFRTHRGSSFCCHDLSRFVALCEFGYTMQFYCNMIQLDKASGQDCTEV